MSLLDVIRKALNIRRPEYGLLTLGRSDGIPRSSDARSLVSKHAVSWVWVCASTNARTVAGVPLRLYVRGGTRDYYTRRALDQAERKALKATVGVGTDNVEEITGGHPLLDLLDYFNAEQTLCEGLEATVLAQELTGDAYWYLEPGKIGLPQAIYPLMPQYVKVVRDANGTLVGYLYGRNSTTAVALDASEVIHFRLPHPNNPDYGLGPLEAAFGAATLLEAQQEYLRTMYDAGGMPEVGIIVKGQVSESEKRRLYADWRDRFASRRRGEKAIILEGDITDLKTFGYPPTDTGVEFAQRFSREEICAAFGVPLTMVQLSEASRAGAEAGHFAYLRFTILPKLQRIQEKLTERLCALYDPKLFLAFDNPVPEDRTYELKALDTYMRHRIKTINEVRSELGLEPVEGGDALAMPAAQRPATEPDEQAGDHNADTGAKGTSGETAPMTAAERRFTDELVGHIEGLTRETVERLREGMRA